MRSRRDPKKRSISENLTELSQSSVGKLLRRTCQSGSLRKKQQSDSPQLESCRVLESEVDRPSVLDATQSEPGATSCHGEENIDREDVCPFMDGEEMDNSDWEDGSAHALESTETCSESSPIKGMTVELDLSPDVDRKKPIRRVSAEDKEFAELVHKVHLLCLLARGRIVDKACDDPLIQASLLSLIPKEFLNLVEVGKLTAKSLSPLVSWFHNHFKVTKATSNGMSFPSSLAYALENQNGSSEEITALSVALFRALKLTARFVSILDVVSLKPELEKGESSSRGAQSVGKGIFKSPTVMVAKPNQISESPGSSKCTKNKNDKNDTVKSSASLAHQDIPVASETESPQRSKRKGDLEFEMQMQIALSATAFEGHEKVAGSGIENSTCDSSSSSKRLKKVSEEPQASSQFISTAVGAKKDGSPLYWAEVFCNGENLTGKWVHADVVNAIVDGEQKVEEAAAACKTSLRYVVAFAGHGAKDVTRRYCVKWYKIASKRISSAWWDKVLAPLKELESGATGDLVNLSDMSVPVSCLPDEVDRCHSANIASVATRSSIEDMELETRALTEPLPTNQQAYKNHPLYALERWLTKYQILHPKGPLLGLCSGHPVYPRSCVQTLKTKERWLREGLQVKAKEHPAKILKRSGKFGKGQVYEEDDDCEANSEGTIDLYGRWQLEPLVLPHAAGGIVPKNERGQVDVWSEKCLPPGTVHLKFPRIFAVAKKLEIDYAPAMVGFEFRSGRATPIFDGIVVCSEFKDIILEAYAEENARREAEERKRDEREAISRWYQLLSSILTRQRLNNLYGDGLLSSKQSSNSGKTDQSNAGVGNNESKRPRSEEKNRSAVEFDTPSEDHEHVFLRENETFDEESSVLTKRCHCGFAIEVEEL